MPVSDAVLQQAFRDAGESVVFVECGDLLVKGVDDDESRGNCLCRVDDAEQCVSEQDLSEVLAA